MFDFSQIFDYNYIFEYIPQWHSQYSWISWMIYLGILGIGIILVLVDKFTKQKKFFIGKLKNKILPLTNTVGIIGIILTFFRYQTIPYLSSRLLIYCLIFTAIVWILFILWYFLRKYPKERFEVEEEFRKKRYLKFKKIKKKRR